MFLPSVRQCVAFWLAHKRFYLHGEDRRRPENAILAAFVDGQGSWYEQPCQVYLYDTLVSGVRKFGISRDHTERAKSARALERDRYVRCAASFDAGSRRVALIIEDMLLQETRADERLSPVTPDTSEDYIAARIGISREFTRMPVAQFKEIVTSALAGIEALGRVGFLRSIKPPPWMISSAYEWAGRIRSRRMCLLDTSQSPEMYDIKTRTSSMLRLCDDQLFEPGKLFVWGQYEWPALSWEAALEMFHIPVETEPDWVSRDWDLPTDSL